MMVAATTESRRRWSRILGSTLAAQFILMVSIKIATGLVQEVAWMSHVALVVAAIGLICSNSILIATAFVGIGVLHCLWLADCFCWIATGEFPLGITNYLRDADGWVWLSTLHHFYLLPVLIWAIRGVNRWPQEAFLAAVAAYLVLTTFSHAMLDRALNVNYAFGVLTAIDHPLVHLANRLPGATYLLGLVSFVTVFMFMPADMVGRRLVARRRERQQVGQDESPVFWRSS